MEDKLMELGLDVVSVDGDDSNILGDISIDLNIDVDDDGHVSGGVVIHIHFGS